MIKITDLSQRKTLVQKKKNVHEDWKKGEKKEKRDKITLFARVRSHVYLRSSVAVAVANQLLLVNPFPQLRRLLAPALLSPAVAASQSM